MPGGQFLELLLLKWSDFDNSKIAAGYFTHNYGLDRQANCEQATIYKKQTKHKLILEG